MSNISLDQISMTAGVLLTVVGILFVFPANDSPTREWLQVILYVGQALVGIALIIHVRKKKRLA